MTRDAFDEFCPGLPGTTRVIQWGDASEWKVGGKAVAIGGWSEAPEFAGCAAASGGDHNVWSSAGILRRRGQRRSPWGWRR